MDAELAPARSRRSRRVSARLAASAWFASWGMAVGSATYLQSALRHGWRTVVLFVLLPGVAAGLAGAITGPALLERGDGGVVRSGAIGVVTRG